VREGPVHGTRAVLRHVRASGDEHEAGAEHTATSREGECKTKASATGSRSKLPPLGYSAPPRPERYRRVGVTRLVRGAAGRDSDRIPRTLRPAPRSTLAA